MFINQLAAGEYEAATARFDDAMLKAAPAPALKQIWEQLLGQVGAYQEQLDATLGAGGGLHPLQRDHPVRESQDRYPGGLQQPGADQRLVLQARRGLPSRSGGLHRPDYVDPEIHRDRGHRGQRRVGAAGTLSMPAGDGPFPAVVLVHGSGPNDRDETIGPNKPFKDLAWGLASQGIAVLRYDKRTKAHASQFTPGA